MTAQEQVDYPLPVIHMNGTGAEELMAGYENIYDCINKLQAAMEKCIVHPRDYYPLDINLSPFTIDLAEETPLVRHSPTNCGAAAHQRNKHNKAINDFKEYILHHMVHLREQSK